MRKNFVLVGLAIIALTVLLLPVVGKSVISGILSGGQNYTIVAPANEYAYANVTLTANAPAAAYIIANRTTDVYALNGSEFSGFESVFGNAVGLSRFRAANANTIEGAEIFTNTSNTVALLENPHGAPRAYNYYVVIDNTGSANAVAGYVDVVYLSNSAGMNIAALGVAVIAGILAGAALIIYGLVKKAPTNQKDPEQEEKDKAYVDSLYKSAGAEAHTKRKAGRKRGKQKENGA
jgi:hypothetical protein